MASLKFRRIRQACDIGMAIVFHGNEGDGDKVIVEVVFSEGSDRKALVVEVKRDTEHTPGELVDAFLKGLDVERQVQARGRN